MLGCDGSQYSHLVNGIYYKESWSLKNWCFWTVVLEKTLESHLDCQEIKSVHPKGNQPWIFTRRADAEAEAETPILWPPMQKADSLEKILMLGKIEGSRRGWQRMRWLDGIIDSIDINLIKVREKVRDREAWPAAVPGITKSRTQLGVWTRTYGSYWDISYEYYFLANITCAKYPTYFQGKLIKMLFNM